MNNILNIISNDFVSKKKFYLVIILTAMLTGLAITKPNMMYAGLLLSPLLIYLSLHKPFIFPFGLYVMLIPFDSVLAITANNATLTKFLAILTMLVLLFKGLMEGRLKRPDAISFTWIAFSAYCSLTFLWAIQPDIVIGKLPTVIGLLSLYIVAASYDIHEYDYDILKIFIVIGGFLAAVYSIYNYFNMEYMRASLKIGERSTDINDFAFSLLIPISLCIQLLMSNRIKIIKVLFVVFLTVTIYAVVITGSRGGFLGVCTIVFIYLLNMKRKFPLIALFFFVLLMISSFVPDIFFERWEVASETGGAGRMTIWYVGMESLSKHWAFGAGLSNFPNAFNEFSFTDLSAGWSRGAHNIYLQSVVELGIFGFVIMLVAMISHYNILRSRFKTFNNEAIMLKASYWGVLISSAFLGTLWQKSFWLLWILIIISKKKGGRKKLDNDISDNSALN